MAPTATHLLESKTRHAARMIACFSLAVLLFLPWMTRGPLRHWDEAWYAQASREMLRHSSWLTVWWNGAPWFHKPPLSLWGTALSFQWFGESEFSARLFSGLCTLALLLLITSVDWSESATASDRSVGLLAALLLLGVPDFLKFTTRGQMDGPIAFMLAAQLVCFLRGRNDPRWHWLAGIFFGLGIMTKGAAAGLALVVQGSYMLLAGERRPMRQPEWWLSLGLGVAIALPWHVHQAVVHGEAFWKEYGSRHFSQFFMDIHPEESITPAKPLFYWNYLLHKQTPWGWLSLVILGLAAGFTAWRRDRALALAFCWGASIPIALSFSRAKWGWYLVPAYPGIALTAALLVAKTPLWRSRSSSILLAAAAIAVLSNVQSARRLDSKEHEEAIRELAPTVQKFVPVNAPIHALQMADHKQSVFAIATMYYCDRPVHVARGLEHLQQIAENAANPFCLLAHKDAVRELMTRNTSAPIARFELEILDESNPVTLVRITPTAIQRAASEPGVNKPADHSLR
ncbi:MAG: glycosyltransferase family 39 protein [Planctomycetota bacterium]